MCVSVCVCAIVCTTVCAIDCVCVCVCVGGWVCLCVCVKDCRSVHGLPALGRSPAGEEEDASDTFQPVIPLRSGQWAIIRSLHKPCETAVSH